MATATAVPADPPVLRREMQAAAVAAVAACPLPFDGPPGIRAATPLSLRRTSAADVGFRTSLPPKMMSSMRSPRRLLALCSPRTHVRASTTLLLPQPFGPTMAVTPSSNVSSARSGKLLKPAISRRWSRMNPLSFVSSRQKTALPIRVIGVIRAIRVKTSVIRAIRVEQKAAREPDAIRLGSGWVRFECELAFGVDAR